MKRYKSRRISREVAVECVTKLFEGHDDLLVEFNSFLPPQLRRNVNTENSPNLVEEQFGEIFDKLIENPTKEIGKKFLAHFQKLDQVTFHVFKIWLFEDESRRETFLNLLDSSDISIIYCVIYCFKSLIVTPPFFNRKRFLENTLTTTIKTLFETKLIPKLIRVLSSHYDIPELESSIVEMLVYYFNSATNSKRQKRKNNEHSPCCENFGRFFQQSAIPADVFLHVEDQVIPCHRIILAARSPFFEKLFTNGMEEQNKQSVTLRETSYDSTVKIIKYLYSNEIDLTPEEAAQICSDATFFQLPSLEVHCCKVLVDHLDKDNIFIVWDIISATTNPIERILYLEKCVTFLLSSWSEVPNGLEKTKILTEFFTTVAPSHIH